ncbi:MAG: DUF2442 domain-containing protein, partial [Bacteroidota bacterium]|nr:DUF2442 domain-containing protein [Bacteroidota bacterium]
KRKNNQKNKVEMKTIRIEKARYIDGYKVEIKFNDKTVKIVDFSIFFEKHPHPQHDKYRDTHLFKQFKIEAGNLVWGENWDLIFPIIQLYKGRIKA